jgi:Rhodopirellula transposase DDE domain
VLREATAGDPVAGIHWTHRSLRTLRQGLRYLGIKLAAHTLARLMRRLRFGLRTNRDQVAEVSDPERERQFRPLIRLRRLYLTRGWPVISVDTKEKELIGPFKDPGRCWRKQPRAVFAHDFPRWAKGRGIPDGISDVGHNDGYVVVGTSHETPGFAGAAIRRWWPDGGRRRYPQAQRLLIQADAGGAND